MISLSSFKLQIFTSKIAKPIISVNQKLFPTFQVLRLDAMASSISAGTEHIVRVRGIPFSAGKAEMLSFFAMCKVKGGKDGVHFTYLQHGRPSGEAFVVFETDADLQKALKMHKEYMGSRYIEVFVAQPSEFEWVMRRNQFESFDVSDAVLRLRGCPFGTTKDDVIRFFAGLDIVDDGVVIPLDPLGRPGGEAYAQFKSKDIAEEAMKLNREKMGHRYIELFKSSTTEMRAAERGELPSAMPGRGGGRGGFSGGRPGPYDRMDSMGGGGGFGGRNIKGPGGRGGGMGGFNRGDMEAWGYGGDMGNNGYGGARGGGMMGGRGGGMGGGFGFMRGGGRPRTGPGSDHVPTTGHAVHMRGLPWKVGETDICCFFNPLVPAAIHIHYEPDGRAKGTADVDFNTYEEAAEAMKKSGQYIDTRYIDLFLNSDGPPGAEAYMMGDGMITRRGDGGGFTKTVTPSRMAMAGAGMRDVPGETSIGYGGERGAAKDEGWGGSAGWGGGAMGGGAMGGAMRGALESRSATGGYGGYAAGAGAVPEDTYGGGYGAASLGGAAGAYGATSSYSYGGYGGGKY